MAGGLGCDEYWQNSVDSNFAFGVESAEMTKEFQENCLEFDEDMMIDLYRVW